MHIEPVGYIWADEPYLEGDCHITDHIRNTGEPLYVKEDLIEIARLLAEVYNSSNTKWNKTFRNEVRHTLRSAGYTIEELDDKTSRAVKSSIQNGYVVRCDCGTSYCSDTKTIHCPECV